MGHHRCISKARCEGAAARRQYRYRRKSDRRRFVIMARLKVGVLGATGTVGQRMIQLLERHPWFEVSAVAASDNSVGKNYAQVTRWMLETPIPETVARMTVQSCEPGVECDFVLCGLPSSIAEETELQLAKAGMPVL